MRRRTFAIVVALPVIAAGLAIAIGGARFSFPALSAEGAVALLQAALQTGWAQLLAVRTKLMTTFEYGYLKSPEMIVGVGTALALPVVAFGSLVARFLLRWRQRRLRVEPDQIRVFDSPAAPYTETGIVGTVNVQF